ncbi:MAG TPA: PhzF family phenazine biosynthesis isomerase, partial [Haloplasmataceae bacterium]
MEKLQVFIVDSFAEQPFKGNPCGIVLYADELRELHMKQIAQELNLAETAFVYHKKNGTYKVRYFTPTQEIDFCGHATLAVAWIMADNNILLETNVGLISFEFEYVLNQIDKIYMKQIEPKIKDFTGSLVELFEIFNIKSQDLDSRFPVKLV